MTAKKMKHNENTSMEELRCIRAHIRGRRRTDIYGFERYEDARRDWYILSGEDEAERYAKHDRSRETRCTQKLLKLLFSHHSEDWDVPGLPGRKSDLTVPEGKIRIMTHSKPHA